MAIRLIADSCCDTTPALHKVWKVHLVPFVLRVGEREFTDNEALDTGTLLEAMEACSTAAGSACPSPEAYAQQMREADESVVVTISSKLSGSYNAAAIARDMVLEESPEKKIALSFDAAWGNEDTGKILEILQKQDVHVTFFMTGGWVESYPDDVKAILAAGHDLGNHSENHKNMSQLSDQEKKDELMKVHTKVQELTGYEMFLFRPPYGDYDNAVVNVAKDCGYYTIQWDVDSLDWKDYGVDSIIKTVTQHKHLGNGSIVLCHNGAKYTAEALDTLIATLKNEGYTFVPISELIYKDNYHMNHEGRQIKN